MNNQIQPNNITQYILYHVIKQRDIEIAKLKDTLEKFKFVKCSSCNTYQKKDYYTSCDICDFKCCDDCEKLYIKKHNSWSMRTNRFCMECVLVHCNTCTSDIDDTNSSTCPKCKGIFCQWCAGKCCF